MSKYNSQLNRIKRRLNQTGKISRNECLGTYPAITRLSGIILVLKKSGYEFRVEDTGKDYIYHWTNRKVWKFVEKEDGNRVAQQILIK